MIAALLSQAAPLALAGIGALWSELAGFLAISIEGWMDFGGFFSCAFALWTHSFFWGTVLAALLAAALSWAAACFVIKTRSDPFIVGLALNVGISGGTAAFSSFFFGTTGVLRLVRDGSLPVLHSDMVFAALTLPCALLSALVIRKTAVGLRLRAGGLSASAAAEHGIHPDRYRALGWALAGFFAALAGAALTFRINAWAPGAASGRGWLALASVFLAFRRVRGILAVSLVFALAQQLCIGLQKTFFSSAEALSGIPHLLAFLCYALSRIIARSKIGIKTILR